MAYIPGDYWQACDRCGKRFRKSQMRKTWQGLWVCPSDFEERHPQDFVRGRIDNIAVPVARPWGTDHFLSASITDIADIDNPATTTDDGIA